MCVRPPAAELLGRLKPDALAYLGDAVFEVAVRERLMWPPLKMKSLNSKTFSYVSAEGQHQILEKVTADFGLTEEELDWLRLFAAAEQMVRIRTRTPTRVDLPRSMSKGFEQC